MMSNRHFSVKSRVSSNTSSLNCFLVPSMDLWIHVSFQAFLNFILYIILCNSSIKRSHASPTFKHHNNLSMYFAMKDGVNELRIYFFYENVLNIDSMNLFQRISIAIQRGKSASVLASIVHVAMMFY